jgi:hypothetical protein
MASIWWIKCKVTTRVLTVLVNQFFSITLLYNRLKTFISVWISWTKSFHSSKIRIHLYNPILLMTYLTCLLMCKTWSKIILVNNLNTDKRKLKPLIKLRDLCLQVMDQGYSQTNRKKIKQCQLSNRLESG